MNKGGSSLYVQMIPAIKIQNSDFLIYSYLFRNTDHKVSNFWNKYIQPTELRKHKRSSVYLPLLRRTFESKDNFSLMTERMGTAGNGEMFKIHICTLIINTLVSKLNYKLLNTK